MRVVFSNTRVPYRQVSKLLVLPPGQYQLDGTVKAEGLDTPRGMRWTVSCVGSNGAPLAMTDDYLGTFSWRAFSVSFAVPQQGCVAQTLRIELDARVALDQQAAGVFWTDGISIVRNDKPAG